MNILKKIFNSIKNKFENALFPKHIKCIFCGRELSELNHFDCCEKCFPALPTINEYHCQRCGDQLAEGQTTVCKNCKANNFSFEIARSVFSYKDQIRPIIHKLKYNNAKYLAEPLAYFLYSKFVSLNWQIDIITSVPLHKNRLKQRGYNQSEELAKHLSTLASTNYTQLATREIDNPSQTALDFKDRKKNVEDIFKITNTIIKNKNILIVDDIYTTGATVNELAKLFKKHHAKNVYILTLAHTKYDELYQDNPDHLDI